MRAAYARAWRAQNKTHHREYMNAYIKKYRKTSAAFREQQKEASKRWRERNPEKVAEMRSNTKRQYDEKMKLLNDFREGKSCMFCGNTNLLSVAAVSADHPLKEFFPRTDKSATIIFAVWSSDLIDMPLESMKRFFATRHELRCVCSKCLRRAAK